MAPKRLTARIGLVLLVAGPSAEPVFAETAWVDPTRPPPGQEPDAEEAEEAPPEVEGDLQSILVGDGRRVAVIGGRAHRVGDPVGAFTVTEITADRVVLEGEEGNRILRLSQSAGFDKGRSQ